MKETLKHHAIKLDDFIDDLFGLNMRGLKSIYIIFAFPKRYFDAARQADWAGIYNPSVRLWLAVVAVTFFLKFLWADPSSATVQSIVLRLQTLEVSLPEGVTHEMAANTLARWWFAYLPFAHLICLFLLAAIWPFWGTEKTPLALRARYIFATVVPSSVAAIFTWAGVGWISVAHFLVYLIGIYVIAFALDLTTLLRGLYGKGQRWRAILLAVALLATSLAASSLGQIGALITISMMY